MLPSMMANSLLLVLVLSVWHGQPVGAGFAAGPSACIIRSSQRTVDGMFGHPTETRFTDITAPSNIRGKQSKIRTSPNCLFPSYDNTLGRWDLGGFCQVERLTGGACVGDLDGDGFDDIYYARMDGHDTSTETTAVMAPSKT